MAKFLQARRRPTRYKRRQWLLSKSGATKHEPEQAPDQTVTKQPWHANLIPTGWFRFPRGRNAVNSIVKAFISLYWCVHCTIQKHFILVKNTICPPLICQRELRTLRQRLQKLEAEFSKLHSSLKDKDTNSHLGDVRCCCMCHHGKNVPSIVAPLAEQCVPTSLLPPPPPPPPPPPLPPPPPPPAPVFSLQKRPPVLKKVESNRAAKEASAGQDGPLQIRLEDLLNVKLRKTRTNLEKRKMESNPKECFPLVTISEMQGANLKIASKMPPRRLTNYFIGTPSKSPLDLRRRLRKINMVRSPGGTPIYDRDNKENGTGLNPMMTRALRQKFQLAHPKTPSPLRLSPANRSFEDVL